ncbi:MAG: OmpA family protein [Myxococcota bacterium]|nr:OmpA family protein [Myxococcota bacterium]
MNGVRGVVAAVALASWACLVPRAQYDVAVADATRSRAEAQAKQSEDALALQDLRGRLATTEAALQDHDARLSELTTASHNVQAQLDEATAINQQLRGELERLGKDADKILAERGTLAKALDDAKTRLEELRKAQAAADARAQLFRDLEAQFKPLIDAKQLRIESRRGNLVMNVTGDLLFEPNHVDVRPAGRGVLMEIARALETTSPPKSGRRFLITVHVDEDPLKSRRAKSTWELTAGRAVTVVELLVSLGVSPSSLTAAGAGAFDPLVQNDSAESRAKNRRLEISLAPSGDDLAK